MKAAKPTTYLTVDEIKQLASLKNLDAASGPSGARRRGLMEEAIALEDLAKTRDRKRLR